ncbi:unnamed protein product [Strongylus vulgaris]|uniref:Uncharacterized protein n=1 Tax=Strongylus vulgaris TaxID=40348 RepID=A0A3P7LSG4_STRVU|nr:unnamed protein product [Strongylus vulgaris]
MIDLHFQVFTDRCRDPGVFIGYKHIRGCMDRVLRHAVLLHFSFFFLKFQNQCRTLSRAHLFNPARASDPPAIGDVQLCSCYGDRCNGSNSAALTRILIPLALTFILTMFLQ